MQFSERFCDITNPAVKRIIIIFSKVDSTKLCNQFLKNAHPPPEGEERKGKLSVSLNPWLLLKKLLTHVKKELFHCVYNTS